MNFLKHGINKTACAGALRLLEARQLSGMTHNHSYAPARTTNLRDQQNNSNFPRKMQGKVSSSASASSSIYSHDCSSHPGEIQGINEPGGGLEKNRRRPSSILPIGITFACNNKSKQRTTSEVNNPGSTGHDQPKVVLTPESPYDSKLGSKS